MDPVHPSASARLKIAENKSILTQRFIAITSGVTLLSKAVSSVLDGQRLDFADGAPRRGRLEQPRQETSRRHWVKVVTLEKMLPLRLLPDTLAIPS